MRRRTWAAGLATGALAAAAITVTTLPQASGADVVIGPAGTPTSVSSTLTWTSSGTTSTIRSSTAATGATPQTISAKNCVATSSGSSYLVLTPTGPKVNANTPAGLGFKDLSLGVRSGNDSNGTSCKQVNRATSPVESVRIAAGADAGASTNYTRASLISSLKVDLNLSGNAVVLATMYKGGTVVGKAEMQSGFSAPQTPQDSKAQLFICNYRSNSGPQSGYNNNCYWDIRPLQVAIYPASEGVVESPGGWIPTAAPSGAGGADYDAIVLTPIVGDFSIQGGNAWPASLAGSAGTIIELESFSDGQLGCYNPSSPTTILAARASALGDPRAVVTRLTNGPVNGAVPACVLKPYTYSDSGNTSIFRQKLTDGQSTAQFAIVLPRDYTAADVAAATNPTWPPLPGVSVNWEDGTDDVVMTYCPTGLITSQDSANYYVPTVNYSKLGPDQTAETDGIQFACIYRQSNVQKPDGSIEAFDYLYVHGDILLKGSR
jgi:hypothetical protein